MGRVSIVVHESLPGWETLQKSLQNDELVDDFIVMASRAQPSEHLGVRWIHSDQPHGGGACRRALASVASDYCLLIAAQEAFHVTSPELERLVHVADQTQAGLVYTDTYREGKDGLRVVRTIDHQLGSLRDSFDFGPMMLYSTSMIQRAFAQAGALSDSRWSAAYELRLKVSEIARVMRLPEPLGMVSEQSASPGDSHFDYLDPRHEPYQKELEQIATEHLRRIRAWLPPVSTDPPVCDTDFHMQASVVIPVRNRERTIADAVHSALGQEVPYSFNVIVVDNHSTDKTTSILEDIARKDSRLVHVVPESLHLGIGGCWNVAARSAKAGRYLVQLDSDDIYSGKETLARMVAAFEQDHVGMVIGAYRVVDFDLNELPPGVVAHREWTSENGHNNALRVNGFGAPRAFRTDLVRRHPFPNVSYGEDYAVGLRFSRSYRVGRIYDPIYLCRRWEDNTDAALPEAKINEYNTYKDRLRSIEILARQDCHEENAE